MDLAHHVAELEDQGFTILERVIEDEVVDALVADVERLEAHLDRTPDNNRFEGNRTTRTYNLLAHGDVWQQVPVRPEVCTLIESQLGTEFLVSSLASISLAPGEEHRMQLAVSTGGALRVAVADARGRPLAGVHVEVEVGVWIDELHIGHDAREGYDFLNVELQDETVVARRYLAIFDWRTKQLV